MYKCSCMSLVNRGITCRHYFSVMLRTPEARFHVGLLNQRWFTTNHPELKNRLFYPASKFKVDLEIPFLEFNVSDSFNSTNDSLELNDHPYVSLSEQRLYYVSVHGLAKKASQIACKSCDESFVTLLEKYINKKNREALDLEQSGSSQIVERNDHQIINDLEIDQENVGRIGNPIIRRPKGRPPGTARFKGPLETSNEVNKIRKCGLCNESGHNRTTCPMNTNRRKRKNDN